MLLLNDAFNSFAFASLLYGTNGQADSCHTAHFVARSWQIPKCSLCCHRKTRKLAEQHLPLSFLTVRQACMATRILKAVKNVIITHAWVTFRPDPTRGPFELINYVGDFEGNGLLKIRLPIREFTLQFGLASPRLLPVNSGLPWSRFRVSHATAGAGLWARTCAQAWARAMAHGSPAMRISFWIPNQTKSNWIRPSQVELKDTVAACFAYWLTDLPSAETDWLTNWLTGSFTDCVVNAVTDLL